MVPAASESAPEDANPGSSSKARPVTTTRRLSPDFVKPLAEVIATARASDLDRARSPPVPGITSSNDFREYDGLDSELQDKVRLSRLHFDIYDQAPYITDDGVTMCRDKDMWAYNFLDDQEVKCLQENMIFEDEFPDGYKSSLAAEGDEDDLLRYWQLLNIIHKVLRNVYGGEFFDWEQGRATLHSIHNQIANRLFPVNAKEPKKRKTPANPKAQPRKKAKGDQPPKDTKEKKSKGKKKMAAKDTATEDAESDIDLQAEQIEKLLNENPDAKINQARKVTGIKAKDTKNVGISQVAKRFKQSPAKRAHLQIDPQLTNEIVDEVKDARKHGGLSDKQKQEQKPRMELRPSSEWDWVKAAQAAKIEDPYQRHCEAEYAYDYRGKLMQRVWPNVLNAKTKKGKVIMTEQDRERVIGNSAQWRRQQIILEHPWMDDVLDADSKPRARPHSRIILMKDPVTGKQLPWSKDKVQEIIQRGEQACCDIMADAGWRSVRDNFFMREFEKLKSGELDPHIEKARDERALLDRESWQMIKDRIFFNNWTKQYALDASKEMLTNKKRMAKELVNYQREVYDKAWDEIQVANQTAEIATKELKLLENHFQVFGSHYTKTASLLDEAQAENSRLRKQILELQAPDPDPETQSAELQLDDATQLPSRPEWMSFLPPLFPLVNDGNILQDLTSGPNPQPLNEGPLEPSQAPTVTVHKPKQAPRGPKQPSATDGMNQNEDGSWSHNAPSNDLQPDLVQGVSPPNDGTARGQRSKEQKDERERDVAATVARLHATFDDIITEPVPSNLSEQHGTHLFDALGKISETKDNEQTEGNQHHGPTSED